MLGHGEGAVKIVPAYAMRRDERDEVSAACVREGPSVNLSVECLAHPLTQMLLTAYSRTSAKPIW
jgi:hypothetical protein